MMIPLYTSKPFVLFILLQLACYTAAYSQAKKSLFGNYINKEIPQNKYAEILVSKDGNVYVSASEFSIAMISGQFVGAFIFGLSNQGYGIKNLKTVFNGPPIKTLTESTDGNIFFSTAENQIAYITKFPEGICDIPPFYFPVKEDSPKEITKLWFDKENNLYIGVTEDAFYIVPKAGNKESLDTTKYKIGRTNDSNMVILKGELPVKKIIVSQGSGVYSFAESRTSKNIIWLGSGNGLFSYDKVTGEVNKIFPAEDKLTLTHIETFNNGDIWFSTLEKGMGVYHQLTKTSDFFSYPKKQAGPNIVYPIQDFCIKSKDDFFVAVKDSLPAIFNLRNGTYKFLNDTAFNVSKNSTTAIRLISTGHFYLVKGGMLYSANLYDNPEWIGADSMNITYAPLIYGVFDFNKREITSYVTNPELLKKLKLKYNQNSIVIYFTSSYFPQNKKSQFAWKLDGYMQNWVELPNFSSDNDSSTRAELPDIKPGKYTFHVKIRAGGGEWSKKQAQMEIIITPPYWATWWFWAAIIVSLSLLIYIIVRVRVRAVRKAEKLKSKHEKDLLELEAKALRAQMNPHFVFNCMNSIKSLIQKNDQDNAVTYLTTFSKLIRTIFQNSDKREISLHDEIETCKLYTQLESLRFGNKFNYHFKVDEAIDLKSVQVPALIIQPFIENAIWHGIMPKEDGGNVTVSVEQKENDICCIIDDDGIGREVSKQNKFKGEPSTHQSKGIHLTQSRLDLDNALNKRNATLETTDKKDAEGKSSGTIVVLTFKEY